MNPELSKVIPAIISNIAKSGGDHTYVTKTKLLKLLYLFDVEYYRVHRKTFTGFNWIYYELGPWTQEYYELLEQVERQGNVHASPSPNLEYDTEFFRADFVDIFGLLESHRDEGILRTVLHSWGGKRTGEILDYVYFETEPMLFGERYLELDFSHIPVEAPIKYSLPEPDHSRDEIRKLKLKFKKKLAALPPEPDRPLTTPPVYDEAFFELMAELEKDR